MFEVEVKLTKYQGYGLVKWSKNDRALTTKFLDKLNQMRRMMTFDVKMCLLV